MTQSSTDGGGPNQPRLAGVLNDSQDLLGVVPENSHQNDAKYQRSGMTLGGNLPNDNYHNGLNSDDQECVQLAPAESTNLFFFSDVQARNTFMDPPESAQSSDICPGFNRDPYNDFIEPEMFGPFSAAMDMSVLQIQEAVRSGHYGSPSWFTGEERPPRAHKQHKPNNTTAAAVSTVQNRDDEEIIWAKPTEEEPGVGAELVGVKSPSDEAAAFSPLAEDAEFTFSPGQHAKSESSVDIPTWSTCMSRSAVFLGRRSTSKIAWDPNKWSWTPQPLGQSDGSCDEKEEGDASRCLVSSSDKGESSLGREAEPSEENKLWECEASSSSESGKRRSGSRASDTPPRRLSNQINLEAWKLLHVLNEKGDRPCRSPRLASRYLSKRRDSISFVDADGDYRTMRRTPSPPAHRPTAWQGAPAWSHVYRVAGLRYPKVLADQVEIMLDKKEMMARGKAQAKEVKRQEKLRAREEKRRKAAEKREAEKKKKEMEREMKISDRILVSLRSLFCEDRVPAEADYEEGGKGDDDDDGCGGGGVWGVDDTLVEEGRSEKGDLDEERPSGVEGGDQWGAKEDPKSGFQWYSPVSNEQREALRKKMRVRLVAAEKEMERDGKARSRKRAWSLKD